MEYVISDPHLGDTKLRERTRKEFESDKELAEYFVRKWNRMVMKDDIVYLLGDLGTKEYIKEYIPQLNGKIVLIRGNHDKYSRAFYDELFDYVYKKPFFLNARILLSHIPQKVNPGVINIHGHTHMIDVDIPGYFNVSADRVGFVPQPMKQYYDYLGKIEKPSYKFLHEWYAHYQRPIVKREDIVVNNEGRIDVEETLKLRK